MRSVEHSLFKSPAEGEGSLLALVLDGAAQLAVRQAALGGAAVCVRRAAKREVKLYVPPSFARGSEDRLQVAGPAPLAPDELAGQRPRFSGNCKSTQQDRDDNGDPCNVFHDFPQQPPMEPRRPDACGGRILPGHHHPIEAVAAQKPPTPVGRFGVESTQAAGGRADGRPIAIREGAWNSTSAD